MSQFPYISPGRPLPKRADTLNAQMEAARETANRSRDEPARRFAQNDPSIIRVKNNSGSDVPKYGVLGLGDVQVTHATNADSFLQRVYMDGEEPNFFKDRDLPICITLQAIPDGEIGFAASHGVVQCQVEMKEDWHEYVDYKDNSVTELISAPASNHKLLWSASSSGTQWAVVHLNGGDPRISYAELTAVGSGSKYHEGVEYYRGADGDFVVGDDTFTSATRGEIKTSSVLELYNYNNYHRVYWARGITGDNDAFTPTCETEVKGKTIPVTLISTSGSGGSVSTRASFVYRAEDLNANVLQTGIDPNAGTSSQYRRPLVGEMTVATHGWGHINHVNGDTFILEGCNEYLNFVATDVVSDSDPSETKITIATPGTA